MARPSLRRRIFDLYPMLLGISWGNAMNGNRGWMWGFYGLSVLSVLIGAWELLT